MPGQRSTLPPEARRSPPSSPTPRERNGTQDVVLAVDRAGAVAGWPLLLPGGGFVARILASPDGTLIVTGGAADEAVVAWSAVDPNAPE